MGDTTTGAKRKAARFLDAANLQQMIADAGADLAPNRPTTPTPPPRRPTAPLPPAKPGEETKTITIKTDNLAIKLNALTNTDKFKLAGNLQIELKVKLTGESEKQNEKNELFAIDVEKIAHKHFDEDIEEIVAKMVTVLLALEKQDNPKAFAAFQETFEKTCKAYSDLLSTKLEKQVSDYIASNKAIKAAYRRYQVNCVTSLITNVTVIVTSIGVTAATWGATGPVAVVAIVRSCIDTGVQIYNMAIDARQVIEDIESNFNTLGDLMVIIDKNTKDPNSVLAKNSAFEAGLGAIAGILNFPLPTVAEVGKKMELLESKLQGIHVERLSLGKQMRETTKEIEAYDKKIHAPDFDKTKTKKYEGKITAFKVVHKKIFDRTEAMFYEVTASVKRQKEFDEQLEAYKNSVHSLARKSRAVFGFATSVGLGVGSSAGNALEMALAGFNECLSLVAEQVRDL
jgi:hypothetical protein